MVKILLQDLDNIENICIRFGERQDIYADRVIYVIAVTIYHILKWILKTERGMKE